MDLWVSRRPVIHLPSISIRRKQEQITPASCTYNISKPEILCPKNILVHLAAFEFLYGFHIGKLGVCIIRHTTVLIVFNFRSTSVVAHRHTIPCMHEQFRGILSGLLGKFSGINSIVSVFFSVYSWSLNYRQITTRVHFNFSNDL